MDLIKAVSKTRFDTLKAIRCKTNVIESKGITVIDLKHKHNYWIQLFLLSLLTICASTQRVYADVPIYQSNELEVNVGFDAKSAAFFQNNSWFGEDEANIGEKSDDWLELALIPAVDFTYITAANGEVFGGFSLVGTKTFSESADGLGVGYGDPSSSALEKAFLGWRTAPESKTMVEITAGNFNYEIGTGFLIKDGGSDGGDRGAFYIGAREAYRRSGLLRITSGDFLAEGFYLSNNPRRGAIEGDIAGFNLEYAVTERSNIGFTYINLVTVDETELGSATDKLNIYDVRADVKPTDNIALSGEYVFQGGGPFEGEGWWLQASYVFNDMRFTPTLTYRYALVSGDDPDTDDFEEFVPLTYGFTDYEQWYQGEITGNWIFANTNQRTHLVKTSLSLTNTITVTGAWLNFVLDEKDALGVSSDDFGDEFNLIVDWQANEQWFLSAAVAVMRPDEGAKQFTGGDDTWSHFMLYMNYSY